MVVSIITINLLHIFFYTSLMMGATVSQQDQQVAETEPESIQIQRRKILGDLFSIKESLRRMNHRKGRLTDELLFTESQVSQLAQQIAQSEDNIVIQKSRLTKHVRALFRIIGPGYPKILFASSSFSDLARKAKYLKLITDKEYEMIKNYQFDVKTLRANYGQLQIKVRNLLGLQKKVRREKRLLESKERDKVRLVAQLEQIEEQNVHAERELNEDRVNDLFQQSFMGQKGRLSLPVTGELKHCFGLIAADDHSIRYYNKGLVFNPQKDSGVQSVFSGTVVYLGILKGVGKTIVVDHGNDYYSLYSYDLNPLVKLGQKVQPRQIIARAAPSLLRNPQVYFEVRHFSEPEDAGEWIESNECRGRQTSSHLGIARK